MSSENLGTAEIRTLQNGLESLVNNWQDFDADETESAQVLKDLREKLVSVENVKIRYFGD